MTDRALGSNGFAHVGIVVSDIEASIGVWSAILGIPAPEIIVTDTVDIARTEYRGDPSTARAKLVFFHMRPMAIELIEPIGEPSSWHEQLVQHGESLHHIAFRIAGMPERLQLLAGEGFQLAQRGEYTGGRYAYLAAARSVGAIVELLEDD